MKNIKNIRLIDTNIKKLHEIARPFPSRLPHLVFNEEYSALEIIGDYMDPENTNHYHLVIDRMHPDGNLKPVEFEKSLFSKG